MSEWYGGLPERWENAKLRQVFKERKEKNTGKKSSYILSVMKNKGVLPYAEKGNVGNKHAEDIERYSVVHIDDIVMNSMNVIIGSVGRSNYHGVLSPVYYVLFVMDNKRCTVRYYDYVFQMTAFQSELTKYGNGILAHRMRIPMEKLKNVILPLPPLNEQDQIVRYLDWKVSRINKLINAKRRQIELLEEQKQTVINEAVTRGGEGWQDIRLGCIGSFRKGFGGSRADDNMNGVACIRYGDIYRTGVLSLDNPITRISQQVADSYTRIYKSEVLFALSGETKEEIGQALINNIDEDTWCSGDTAIFTANNKMLPQLLVYILRCPYIIKQRASLAKGDIIVHISTGALRQLQIFVPPLSEQKEILKELNYRSAVIENGIANVNKQIPLLTEYRTRLISDVVTGKLDVRGINIPEYEALEDAGEEYAEDVIELEMEE